MNGLRGFPPALFSFFEGLEKEDRERDRRTRGT
jgi:hypothetical protein